MTRPLVLLPGMMCDERLFVQQIAVFGRDRDVIVPKLTGATSMEALAENVLAEAPPCFALAGVSMGGILAMECARQAQHRITHLALIDTNPFAEREEMKQRRAAQLKAVESGLLKSVMREDMKPNYFIDPADGIALRDLCMEMALSLGTTAFIEQSMALRDRPDYCSTLRRVTCPTLILCGRHDRLCPVERHEAMKQMMPHARLCIIEDAGHLPTIETPDQVTLALKNLLEIQDG